jgi:hypothetical protein
MNKANIIDAYSEMLFRNKKERTIGTQKDIDAFQNNYVV